MATAEVQQVTTALLGNCPKEEASEVQDVLKNEVMEAPPTVEEVKVSHESNKEEESIGTDQAIAQDVEAKLDIKDNPEEAKEPKEEEMKRTDVKAVAAVVPVNDEPEEVSVPAEVAMAPEEVEETKDDVMEEKKEAACEEKAHEE